VIAVSKILIVDDDANLLDVLKMRIESAGYEVTAARNEEEAVRAAKTEPFNLSIVDLQLGDGDGISLMKQLRLILPDMPVIILTAFGTIESTVRAMKDGAYDYLTKPFDARDLFAHIENALEHRRLASEIGLIEQAFENRQDFPGIVTGSDKMRNLLGVVARIAPSDSTVFITGESGTGKELIARAVHFASPRKEKPIVALNCAAVPEPLLESILFGHERGAFTGALTGARGLFAKAQGGTIFLDEIGDMPLPIQAKVLRVLEERCFYPLGSDKLSQVDVRVIVATNKDPKEEVRAGRFRQDLFYRVHVIPIHLPPLRERKEDIPPLVGHFLKKLNQSMKKEIKGLTPGAMRKLMLYDWPGNIRELQNTLECAAAVMRSSVIDEDLLFQWMPGREKGVPAPVLRPLRQARDAFERGYLIELLRVCRGNVSEAATFAGKYRTDFYNVLKKHGLNPGDYR
jgi:two-component system, NtrC family, response regulator GlrR